ncbi:MAG TPA: hypothetical protein VM598_10050 [Bdellovibrionota bacterium]|nr:hypothetical protein [Bdellovibrionota bacterium]
MAEDLKDKAAELVKKVLTVGVGAAFMTEEGVRALVSEIKLPKELIGGILEGASKTKNEFFQNLSREIIARITESLDPPALAQEILERNEIELTVKVNFKPKSGGARVSVKKGKSPAEQAED